MDDIDPVVPTDEEGGDGSAGVAPIGSNVAAINLEAEGGEGGAGVGAFATPAMMSAPSSSTGTSQNYYETALLTSFAISVKSCDIVMY
jgi:hypothetical protein